MKINLILLAGGNGSRMHAGINKVLIDIKGKSCIRRSAEAFSGIIDHMIVVCRSNDIQEIKHEISRSSLPFQIDYTVGGDTRQASVMRGLVLLRDRPDECVLIHDGARCLVDRTTILNVIDSVIHNGNGVASVPLSDTVKSFRKNDMTVIDTPDRSSMRTIQTPQGFIAGQILHYEEQAIHEGFVGTDDASVLEHYGQTVFLTEGNRSNIKLTTPEDLSMIEEYAGNTNHFIPRIGYGYDVHQLSKDRKLILCGTEIPSSMGLLGHSDADVAVHALIDALLGAAALGDIGQLFPDTSREYEGISSMILLKKVVDLLELQRFIIGNIDITIAAQKPKLSPYIGQMKSALTDALNIHADCVSIKATTTEHLGFVGRQEGISAAAVCLLNKLNDFTA